MTNFDRIWLPSLLKPFADLRDEPVCRVWHADDHCAPGVVYIAQVGDLFKIGCTAAHQGNRSVQARISSLKRDSDLKGALRHMVKANCGRGLEKYLHHHFRHSRITGEFYRLSVADLDWIKSLAEFNGAPVEHGT